VREFVVRNGAAAVSRETVLPAAAVRKR
jgi:hypothetical protein